MGYGYLQWVNDGEGIKSLRLGLYIYPFRGFGFRYFVIYFWFLATRDRKSVV